jgi:hypothetical protein
MRGKEKENSHRKSRQDWGPSSNAQSQTNTTEDLTHSLSLSSLHAKENRIRGPVQKCGVKRQQAAYTKKRDDGEERETAVRQPGPLRQTSSNLSFFWF